MVFWQRQGDYRGLFFALRFETTPIVNTEEKYAAGVTNVVCEDTVAGSNAYACTKSSGYSGECPGSGYGKSASVPGKFSNFHNCTCYVAYKLAASSPTSSFTGLGDAVSWKANAAARYSQGVRIVDGRSSSGAITGISRANGPRGGDIAWWSFGHVAYVNDVLYDSHNNIYSVELTEDTYGLGKTAHYVLQRNALAPWPYFYIRFPIK